jgi:rRNA maturation RNase YbeY
VEFRNLQRGERIDRALVERAVRAALAAAGRRGPVSVAVVGDRTMARLNRRWMGRSGPTDVLSFPLDEPDTLGEVIVSAPVCRRQAAGRGASFEEELALLVIHGVLHLCGLDHTLGPAEERRQRALERRAMARLAPRAGRPR